MSPAVALGRTLVIQRSARGWKRKDLVARSGLSYPYIAELETGTKEPSMVVLRALADVFGVRPSQLLVWAEALAMEFPE